MPTKDSKQVESILISEVDLIFHLAKIQLLSGRS
jgi:hypothetical protein